MLIENINNENLLQNLYWLTILAVIVSSASGALKSGVKQFDLFGIIIIAITTGLGGGSLRDMLLGREVFWISDQAFFIASLLSSIIIFMIARIVKIPTKYFLIADSAGLATFGIAGTVVALTLGMPAIIASFMGVMTGVMGGIFRDVLCGEKPVVFSSTLYGVASWLGSLLFIGLLYLNITTAIAMLIAGFSIFILRLIAIYYDIKLPKFRFKT